MMVQSDEMRTLLKSFEQSAFSIVRFRFVLDSHLSRFNRRASYSSPAAVLRL